MSETPVPPPGKRKSRRALAVVGILTAVALVVVLVVYALGANIYYFRTPTELHNGAIPEVALKHPFRIGGLVVEGSIKRFKEGLTITFRLTDMQHDVTVRYRGVLPDLFREGQGVIAEGQMEGPRLFVATRLLAKHDERYMPPEVARALKLP